MAEELPSVSLEPASPGGAGRGAPLGWGTVRASLAVVYFGALFLLIGLLGLWVVSRYAIGSDAAAEKPMLYATGLLYNEVLYLAAAVILTGLFMSAAAPNRCGAKVVAILVLLIGIAAIITHVIVYVGVRQNLAVESENKARKIAPIRPGETKPELPMPWKENTLRNLYDTTRWLVAGAVGLYVIFLFQVSLAFSAPKTALTLGLYFVLTAAASLCILIERFRELFPATEMYESEPRGSVSWQTFAPWGFAWLLAFFGAIELVLVRGAIRRGVVRGDG